MTQPILGILILNYNGQKWLEPLYDSLLADDYKSKRIYLVDNASRDDSVPMTLQRYPGIKVLRLSQNLGYSISYNLAFPYALGDGCDYIICSNNDIRVKPGCLGQLIAAMESDSRIGILGPALLAWENEEPHGFIVDNYPWAVPAIAARSSLPLEVNWVEGSFPMVNRRCLEMLGSFDPLLYLGWEDADFCRRARLHGWRVMLLPSALVHHYGGGCLYANRQRANESNWLRTKNYYIYQLTNPFQNFTKNLSEAVNALLVNLKNCNQAPGLSFATHIRIFALTLREMKTIYKKWQRDKTGGKPPFLTSNHPALRVEVLFNLAAEVSQGNR